MKVMKLERDHKDFYRMLGPIFGSRDIERKNHDRFYDDPGKVWYLLPDQAVASVAGNEIKNFWAEDDDAGERLLKALCQDYKGLGGVIPICYQELFEKVGFFTRKYRVHFMEVQS